MLQIAMAFDLCLVLFIVFWVFPKILRKLVVHVKKQSREINAAFEAEPEEPKK